MADLPASGPGEGLSIQELLYPDLTCFGCGHANPKGLRLRSYPSLEPGDDDVVIARFVPWPEHDNGGGFLNGGIIATLLDCHSGAAVMVAGVRLGVIPAPVVTFAYVTASLDVRYRRPTPLREELTIVAEAVSADESEIVVEAEIVVDGKTCATGRSRWLRWRPR